MISSPNIYNNIHIKIHVPVILIKLRLCRYRLYHLALEFAALVSLKNELVLAGLHH
jgi:hypothetical protein